MLGLPDIGIRRIDVDKILTSTWCFQQLSDIILLLQRVNFRNARFKQLSGFQMPSIIMMNEYRMLQDYVETLQHNGWAGHPVTDRFDEKDENGKVTHREIPIRSLADIGFDLTTNTGKED